MVLAVYVADFPAGGEFSVGHDGGAVLGFDGLCRDADHPILRSENDLSKNESPIAPGSKLTTGTIPPINVIS